MRDLINIISEAEGQLVQFREHKGSLSDSMKTLKTFNTLDELRLHVMEIMRTYGASISASSIVIEPYSDQPDDRIGWQRTFVVNVVGGDTQGVVGFTNGDFSPAALAEDGGKMTWQPFSIPVTITLNLITHASSQEEAHRFVQQSLSGMEIEPGFGNGEQLKIDGGINAVIDGDPALHENHAGGKRRVKKRTRTRSPDGYWGVVVQQKGILGWKDLWTALMTDSEIEEAEAAFNQS